MWLWVVVIAVALWAFEAGDGNPIDGVTTLLNEIVRGARLTHAPADATGVVQATPSDLAAQAGLTLDQYALARMIASEEPHADNVTKAAIAWCAWNEATRRGVAISSLLLHAQNPDHDGLFGSQQDKDPASPNYKRSDRYATTALDPYDGEGQIACGVIDGSIADITNGCQQFDRAALEKNPDKVAANRMAAGATLVMVPGVDPGLRFWRT